MLLCVFAAVPAVSIGAHGRTLGNTASSGQMRVVDFNAAANGCTFDDISAMPPTGKGTGSGVCKNGTDAAGFALDISGTIVLNRTCGANVDTVSLTLAGKVAVTSRD